MSAARFALAPLAALALATAACGGAASVDTAKIEKRVTSELQAQFDVDPMKHAMQTKVGKMDCVEQQNSNVRCFTTLSDLRTESGGEAETVKIKVTMSKSGDGKMLWETE